MKAPDFRYERPETLEAALALLSDQDADAAPLAGGQSLMPMMNFRVAAPDVLVDLNRIPGLDGIEEIGGVIEIGAMARYSALEASDLIAREAPLMARAIPYIAHSAIRNRGTLGGSMALADPAAEMPAVLLVLGAELVLQSAEGSRAVSCDDYFLGVYETAREPSELLTMIRVPKAAPGQAFGFHEIARRHGDYAMAGCCVSATEGLSTVRIGFFGVADRALRAPAAEAALAGSDGGAAALDAAVDALADLPFEGDLNAGPDTKRHLAGVALRRAWKEIAG